MTDVFALWRFGYRCLCAFWLAAFAALKTHMPLDDPNDFHCDIECHLHVFGCAYICPYSLYISMQYASTGKDECGWRHRHLRINHGSGREFGTRVAFMKRQITMPHDSSLGNIAAQSMWIYAA